jgi:hypothetical protein
VAFTAVFELVAQPVIGAHVPSDDDWSEAADFVRARFEPSDRIVGAPAWIDPIVRERLGDLLTLRTASASDLAGATRLWEIAIRGASTRDATPALEKTFGEVRVRMWPLSTEEVLFDLVEAIGEAEVALVDGDAITPCPLARAETAGGGLGRGPLPPRERFVCDPARPWLWVGATVMADLALRPRRCIWQHPSGPEPVRVTFSDVPLGDSLVADGGLDYNNDRTRGSVPVLLRVFVDDELVGELRHEDRDGWTRLEVDTEALEGTRGDVRIETTAPVPHARTFCWSASTRQSRSTP